MPLPSPAFIIDLARIHTNCEILADIRTSSGCRVAHALKAFAMPQVLPIIADYLDGACASGPWEAALAHAHFGENILTCSPAYAPADVNALLPITHHLDFNSPGQWTRYRDQVTSHPRFQSGKLRCGIRINPRCSTGSTPLYDPCGPGSRLGTPPELLADANLDGITGLHFHTLCEQGSEDLSTTLEAVHQHFGELLASDQIRCLNLGGGHWITKPNYNRDLLVRLLVETRKRYNLDELWIEPGEAAVVHTGILAATVLDVFPNADINVAILDVSATAHMPDVLEMPYRPKILAENGTSAGSSGHYKHTYRLGGNSCLAGDVIGDFSFPAPLKPGDRLQFEDMSQYTMVKTTFFNGIPHPALVLRHEDGRLETVRKFTWRDFAGKLG